MKTQMVSSLLILVLANVPSSGNAGEKLLEFKPFNGKNLEGWTFKNPQERSKWKVGFAEQSQDNPRELTFTAEVPEKEAPQLVNTAGGGVDIYTTEKYGDCVIQLEVMVPKGSNSGVYVMGEYEVQILDSFGKETVGPGDLGGLYSAAAPRENAAKAPGEWQTLEIDFSAPRFKDGQKIANARFNQVKLNGTVIHTNVEIKGPTPSSITGKESETGPLMFQGDHGPVAYRNLKILVTD